MHDFVLNTLIYTLIAMTVMFLGYCTSLVFKVGSSFISASQHMAAGVVLGALCVELVPTVLNEGAHLQVGGGFLIGLILMLIIKSITHRLEQKKQKESLPFGLVTAVSVDVFIDGLLIGIAFISGTQAGILVGLAISLEVFLLGVSTSATIKRRRFSTYKIVIISILTSVLIPAGGLFGTQIVSLLPSSYLTFLISFGIATLLYLVVEELLLEAHKVRDTYLTTSTFFIGFLIILLFELP